MNLDTHRNRPGMALALLAAALLAAGAAVAHAATNDPPPPRLTLERAIDEALKANPGLRAAGHQVNAAASEASATARTRLGGLNGFGSYSYLNDAQIIRPISSELLANGILGAPWDRSQAHYGLDYELPLFLGGRLENQIQIARLEARKSAELLAGTRWQVRFNVVSLYSTLQALDQTGLALDEQVAALAQTQSNLDEMVSLGKRPEVDRLKVVEDSEAAKSDRATAGADRRKAASLLLSLLGRDPAEQLVVEPQTEPAGADPAGGAVPGVVTDNSVIRAARLAAEEAGRDVNVARGEFLPSVYAGANVMENRGMTIDRNEATWGATMSVSLPLFEWGSRFSRLKAAREKQAAAAESLREVQLQTQAALQAALARFDAAQTDWRAARARVAAGVEAARIEQVRYATGAGTIEDLLRAVAHAEAARAARASAAAGLVIAVEGINTIAEKDTLP